MVWSGLETSIPAPGASSQPEAEHAGAGGAASANPACSRAACTTFATKIGNPTRYGSVERSVWNKSANRKASGSCFRTSSGPLLAVDQHFVAEILQIAFAGAGGEAGLVEHNEVGQLHVLQHRRVATPIHHGRSVGADSTKRCKSGGMNPTDNRVRAAMSRSCGRSLITRSNAAARLIAGLLREQLDALQCPATPAGTRPAISGRTPATDANPASPDKRCCPPRANRIRPASIGPAAKRA